jgi:hypothetical protein
MDNATGMTGNMTGTMGDQCNSAQGNTTSSMTGNM